MSLEKCTMRALFPFHDNAIVFIKDQRKREGEGRPFPQTGSNSAGKSCSPGRREPQDLC